MIYFYLVMICLNFQLGCVSEFLFNIVHILFCSEQLIFSIKSQGGTVVASATLPECKIIAGSKRYFIYKRLLVLSVLVSILVLLVQRIG